MRELHENICDSTPSGLAIACGLLPLLRWFVVARRRWEWRLRVSRRRRCCGRVGTGGVVLSVRRRGEHVSLLHRRLMSPLIRNRVAGVHRRSCRLLKHELIGQRIYIVGHGWHSFRCHALATFVACAVPGSTRAKCILIAVNRIL